MGVAVNPGVSVGTMNPLTPPSVCAQTTVSRAIEARSIQRFEPFRIQSEPSRRARTSSCSQGRIRRSGSVRPKLPMISPVAIARQPLRFLVIRSVAIDRRHRERALHADERADAGVARLESRARRRP